MSKCRAGKTGSYPTLAAALEALAHIRRTTGRPAPQRAYVCTAGCRAWHLTKQPKRPSKNTYRRR